MNAPIKPSKLIKGATGDWEVVIGLEVHAQVSSQSKLFSGASTEFGGEPNSHVSLVDAAMPGMAASTKDTCEFGAPPNSVEAPENSLASDATWACTSMPTMTSQSPVEPRMSLEFECASMPCR